MKGPLQQQNAYKNLMEGEENKKSEKGDKKIELQTQLNHIEQLLSDINNKEINAHLDKIIPILQSINKSINSEDNLPAIIHLQKLIMNILVRFQNNCDHKFVRQIINLLLTLITKNNFHDFLKGEEKISMIKNFNSNFENSIQQSTLAIAAFIIEKANLENLQEVLILLYFMIETKSKVEDSTLLEVNWLLRKSIRNYRQYDSEYSVVIKFLTKYFVNKFMSLNVTNQLTLKTYANFLIMSLLSAAEDDTQIKELSNHFKSFSLIQCLYTIDLQQPPIKFYMNEQRQDLFIKLCILYIKSNEQMLKKMIKFIIQINSSPVMISNLWSLFNTDNRYLMSEKERIYRAGEIISYFKEEHKQSPKKCLFYKKGSWISKTIQKKSVSLLLLNALIDHPLTKNQQNQSILKIEFEKGVYNLLIRFSDRKNPGFKILLKKQGKVTDQAKYLQQINNYKHESILFNIAIEFRAENRVHIYVETTKLFEINNAGGLGRVKCVMVGTKQQQSLSCGIRKLFSMNMIDEISLAHYIKQSSNQEKEGNNKNKKFNTNEDAKFLKIKMLDQIEIPKQKKVFEKLGFSTKSLTFANVQINTIKTYRQMMDQFKGKQRLFSYILNALEAIKNSNVLQAYIKFMREQLSSFHFTESNYYQIFFIHGFSIFLRKQLNIINCISDIVLQISEQTLKKKRVSKSRILYQIQMKLNLFLSMRAERESINLIKFFQQYLKRTIKQSMQEGYNVCKQISQALNYSLWNCINDNILENADNLKKKDQLQNSLQHFSQTEVSNSYEDHQIELRTNTMVVTSEKDFKDFKYFPGTVRRILNIIVDNCRNDTFVYSQFVSYLNLVLVILSGISLSGGKRFKINQLIIVLEQIYLIFIDLSPQFAKMKQIPEESQKTICVLLSQVYNLLPAIGVLCKIQTEESGDFEEVFYKVYTSIEQRQHNFKNNRAFRLISKFYNICFQLGSFCLKGRKGGFLSYMDYALRFLNHYKEQLQWSQRTNVLTYKDRIALTEIYASCWKFVVGNPKNRNLTKSYSLDRETKIELAGKLNELNIGIYCPYPSKQQMNQNNQNIIQQIIELHLFESIQQKLPTYILANIGPQDLQFILEDVKENIDKNKKLQKQQRLKLYLQMIQIINEYQRPIILEFNEDQFKKIPDFNKKIQLIFKWYQIYKRIKKINELYSKALEQPYSNNHQITNQFQTLLKQPFMRVLEKLGEEKPFQKIKIIIENFVVDNRGEINNGLEVQENKNLYVLKLLKKECQDVNSKMVYDKKKKIKKLDILKLGLKTSENNTFFMTERSQIQRDKISEIENKNLNTISQKVAKKVLLNNRSYFLDMHTKLSADKTNVLNAYYNMIERLSSEEKLLNWGKSKKYDYYNYYILDDYLSEQNVKLMLKRDNVLVFSSMIFGEMPRLIQSKLQFQCRSITYGISIANNLFDLNSNKFFEFVNQRVKNYEPKKNIKEKNKDKLTGIKLNSYLITKSKIYQGRIQIKGQFIEFFQNNYIDVNMYKQFYANQSEKRTYQEIAVAKKTLKIQISSIKYSHPKKYLQKFYSLEVYASSLSYFFVFQNKDDRQKFLNYSKIENRTASDNIQYVNQVCQAWEKRWISNFQYLMIINNIAGRSLNDVSQYYVMPWTVKNFKGLMDQAFIKNKSNFRDLSKSIGSLNPKKLQVILNKYANSIVESDINQKPYMFGGFYSNSAIVCNYLLRVNPFSVHHYELQGKHFDLYDRLFTNMQNQFDSVYNNTMDNRQLLPEFYSAPQFFRNRNRYNFAYNPRKDRINLQMNMPEWVVTKSPQQFVLKMRKVLQSDSVSQKLCDWIDIIFGKKSQMQNAAENHNLYVHYLYKAKEISRQKSLSKEQKQQLESQTQMKAHMIKQFGQVPKNIFGTKLSPKMSNRQFKQSIGVSEKIRLELTEQTNKNQDGSIIFDFYDCILAVCYKNILTLVNTTEQASRSRYQQIFQEEIVRISLSNIKKTKFILIFLITVSAKLIIVSFKRNMKGTLFIGKREQFKFDKKLDLFPTSKFRNVKTVSNYVILSEQNIIRILKITKEYDKQKTYPMLSELIQDQKTDERRFFYDLGSVYLHRTNIVYLEVYPCLQMVVSVDESGFVNTFSLVPELTMRGTFLLNHLKASETVSKIIIHSVGLLVILTNLKQLMVYNIYGDLIQRVRFQAGISDIQFWNSKSSSEILVSTKSGEIHQIDLFEMVRVGEDCLQGKIIRLPISQNVIKINEKQNNKIIMDRFGKYWSVYVICSAHQNYVYLSEKQFFKIYNTKKFLRCCNQNNSYKNS